MGLALPLTGVIFALNTGAAAAPKTTTATTTPLMPNARVAQQFGASAPVDLPAATTAPAPSPPSLSAIPDLPPHEVFGFAPYWTLAQSPGFELNDLSTIAYFSLDVNPDGSVDESGPGWEGYESQALVNLIDQAHGAGDRVVLTVTCFDQGALDQITSNPGATSSKLSGELVDLLQAKSLDGVNIDFEGNGAQDRAGLDTFVSDLSAQLRSFDPHWQITMDTYASSAGDPGGFYDIAGLAPSVDGFFIMAYDMENTAVPSANAPLTGAANTDTSALEEYEAVVPASKLLLGIPDYGYEWPTSGENLGSPATGPPTALSYSQIESIQSPVYWDPTTETPWTSYETNNQWHQIFFDNPTSIALKARLAEEMHTAGVGIWALGMDGNDPAIYQALLGSASAAKYQIGPGQSSARSFSASGSPSAGSGSPGTGQSTNASGGPASGGSGGSGGAGGSPGSSTSTTSPSYHYSGTWDSHAENLQPANPSTLPGGGEGTSAGQLTGFATNDPRAACLSKGPALQVIELTAQPSEYAVRASEPTNCADGTWTFSAAPMSGTTPSSPLPTLPGGTLSPVSPGSSSSSSSGGLSASEDQKIP